MTRPECISITELEEQNLVSCDLSKDDKAYEDAIKAIREIDGGHLTVVNEDHIDPFELPD